MHGKALLQEALDPVPVDAPDDLHVPRQQALHHLHGPLLEGLSRR